jgi:hypothetical protein
MGTLIITNGDIAAEKMREARINGEILCWRDVLHEGPVPETATLEDLSAIRADYLAWRGWGEADAIRAGFAERDAEMHALDRYSEVTLWFEHDLYDQLQLLQILDFLNNAKGFAGRCSLIQAGSFIGGETPNRLRNHLKLKQPLSETQLALGHIAWSAFRASSPERWAALLRYDTTPLPFLRSAIMRHLEEFPGSANGLGRTERFVLAAIQAGTRTPHELFASFQESEETPFMGDWSFFAILDSLAGGAAPFMIGLRGGPYSPYFADEQREHYLTSTLRLTGLGIATLDGKKDAVGFRRMDKWMGGVHLSNGHCWRWDEAGRMLVAPNGRGA